MIRLPYVNISVAAALFALGSAANEARATPITETYSLSLSNFVNFSGSDPSPMSKITGSFTLTFDPSLSQSNVPLVVNSLSDTLVSGPIKFTNVPASGGKPDFLFIGDAGGNVTSGQNNFGLNLKFLDPADPMAIPCSDSGVTCGSAPLAAFASGFSLAAFPADAWAAGSATVAAVPEPAGWALLLTGVAGLAWGRRLRKT